MSFFTTDFLYFSIATKIFLSGKTSQSPLSLQGIFSLFSQQSFQVVTRLRLGRPMRVAIERLGRVMTERLGRMLQRACSYARDRPAAMHYVVHFF